MNDRKQEEPRRKESRSSGAEREIWIQCVKMNARDFFSEFMIIAMAVTVTVTVVGVP